MIIDNEMCGAILRTVRGVDSAQDELDIEAIERVVTGDGHYLGDPQTLRLMKSEFVYPVLGDRQSVADWTEAGSLSIWDRARNRAQELLKAPAQHLPASVERSIRDRFSIYLNIGESEK